MGIRTWTQFPQTPSVKTAIRLLCVSDTVERRNVKQMVENAGRTQDGGRPSPKPPDYVFQVLGLF